ncbi:nitroreductase family deazaflavin-dependent oxidoreductase [Klenkia sp. PcliD-1-E]|uniref:nitroreductase family deazaflavin-dependent oxidoreductase n=1 Tax=Klenkia sp. PcliD-1-E TaxID=2954492 RepID=UPI00209775A9|nr:nitroreductase family deazaflavin-dependent oxidoreductase [Klenkia sp. PcliD-1-E]MCO7221365.1 nitroreductase family deazaflavin-dependent oxidoreductase [Klenkia sp. PcliD-1-E]
MPLQGEYEPSPEKWVRDQVEAYERSGGREANTLPNRPEPVVIFTTRGAKSGKVRKNPLMKVEHDGVYAMVASQGGAPKHPTWYFNLMAHPDEVTVQDGDQVRDGVAREVHGEEKAQWWERAVAAFPDYADYQRKTDREIPVVLVEPKA